MRRCLPLVLILVFGALLLVVGGATAHPLSSAPGCSILPATNPWNQRIDQLPVAAGSATIMRAAGIAHLHPDFSDSDADGYGIPYNVVGAGTPGTHVAFDYADESDDIAYPIPANPKIEDGSDRHLIIVDTAKCQLDELYDAQRGGGSTWHAGSGATWNLRSNAVRPAGWTSADAAGLPIFPGLARFEELAMPGGIDHALRITLPVTQRAYLFPARHYASDERRAQYAPMGLRIRVKASYSLARFSPQARAILTAGKRYGFIVADNGSAGFISGAPDSGWDDDDLHALQSVPGSALEVVDTSKLTGTPKHAVLWNARWSDPRGAKLHRLQAFHSRSGAITVRTVRAGRVVASSRVVARQGFVQIDVRRIAGARYTIGIDS